MEQRDQARQDRKQENSRFYQNRHQRARLRLVEVEQPFREFPLHLETPCASDDVVETMASSPVRMLI